MIAVSMFGCLLMVILLAATVSGQDIAPLALPPAFTRRPVPTAWGSGEQYNGLYPNPLIDFAGCNRKSKSWVCDVNKQLIVEEGLF